MFTGIIRQGAKVTAIDKGNPLKITISSPLFSEVVIGDSVAINGSCLTIVSKNNSTCTFEVVPESIKKTTLSELQPNEQVNCELAARMNDRFDGHLVQGHVDGIGKIVSKKELNDSSWLLSFSIPSHLMRYVVEKGSIAIDGVSLTVYNVEKETFSVSLIPHSANMTTLGWKSTGSSVNIEVDLMAKYAEKLLADKHAATLLQGK